MKHLPIKYAPFLLFALPAVAFAQPATYSDLVGLFIRIINLVIPIVIGIAITGFLYGVLKYILSLRNEEEKRSGREIMLWGIIALFLMFSVWGILRILTNTFLGGTPQGGTGTFYGIGGASTESRSTSGGTFQGQTNFGGPLNR